MYVETPHKPMQSIFDLFSIIPAFISLVFGIVALVTLSNIAAFVGLVAGVLSCIYTGQKIYMNFKNIKNKKWKDH